MIEFLQWRISQREERELSEFGAWLSVGWLDDKMFMQVAKEVLPFIKFENVIAVNAWLGKFCALLPNLVADVIECSWLLIKDLNKDLVCYLNVEHVQAILLASKELKTEQAQKTAQKIEARLINQGGLNIDDLHAE